MSEANHVAIIMDGNGRWALQKRKSRNYGHQCGLKAIEKIVKNMAEKSKISVRNIRREANDVLKAMLKEKKISEDENNKFEKEIQKITDQQIKKIDEKESQKEKEIMTV